MDARRIALGQGTYFVLTGVWPVVHLPSFEAVTGPKLERWLVKTTGVLIAAIGTALVAGGVRRSVSRELRLLGAVSAAGLAAIELWYAGPRRRIAPIYLADAAIELALVVAWGVAGRRPARAPRVEVEALAAAGAW
jgi:hypothetical protein